MAITTYDELKTAVANWLNRSDLTSRVPEFIVMAESWIAYGLAMGGMRSPPLRIRAMETSTDITITAQTAALPTRFVQARRLYLNTTPLGKLRFYSPVAFWETFTSTGTDQPKGFTVEGENYVFGPSPNGTYTGKSLHYSKFAAFSTASDTNWLLTNAPNVYLFGALLASTTLTQKHPMAMEWFQGFSGSVIALNESDQLDRFSGGSLAMSSDTGMP